MNATSDTPPLTVTIATNDGWQTLRQAYEPLRDQAEAAGAEIVLVDGSGGPAPAPGELGPTTRWIEMPGADISEMRVRAYRDALGQIVAMTEDHVLVAPGWVAAVLRAHQEHPEAAAIGGAVRNGTPHHLVDWASFYAGHAPFLAPLPPGPVPYLSGVNVSYKRSALLAALAPMGDRAIETLINDQIKAAGGILVADDRLVVRHFQSRGIRNTTRLHYYAGRHFEGTRRATQADATGRAVRAIALPLPRAAKRLATALHRGEPLGRVARVIPALVLLASAQAAGELVGIFRGPGRSATKLH
ncbi:MAG: glycosyltransferase [Candidatus Limnocylindrales bacterium]